jgi:hypothetical protein
MHTKRLTAALPADVAQEMIEDGIAVRVPTTRTGVPLADIVVTGLSVVTTIVTLAQAPATLEDIARRLATWRRHASLRHDPVVSVDAAGPNGHVSLQLTSTTNAEEIAHAVSLVLAPSDKGETGQGKSSLPIGE